MDYRCLTDEQLVARCREGDGDAVDFLLSKYKPYVLRFTRARFLAGGERDDLIQEGMIGLYRAIRDYDPGKEARFITFAGLCIDRQILRAIESSQREKNRPLNDFVSMTDEEMEQAMSGDMESPETIVLEQLGNDERLARIASRLSPLEKEVLNLYLAGLDYREIASRIGRTPKQVDNALTRIRKKSAE